MWEVRVPADVENLTYRVTAEAASGASDQIQVQQKVVPAVPLQTLQSTLFQLETSHSLPVRLPEGGRPGRGSVRVTLSPSLLTGLEGVYDYMRRYPYTCLEQRVSRAVSLGDERQWEVLRRFLTAFLDRDGLLKYFPSDSWGSPVLTSYVLAVAHQRDWSIPDEPKFRMLEGLRGFAEGRISTQSSLPTADLTIRKLAALEALSRYGEATADLISTLSPVPHLLPTSALVDWYLLLHRVQGIPGGEGQRRAVEQKLRARLNYQGSLLAFFTEERDRLWWLMASVDSTAARLILAWLETQARPEEMGRLVRGLLARQRQGHWDLTTANAWGVLALEEFARRFESRAVEGRTQVSLAAQIQELDWGGRPRGEVFDFPWPAGEAEVRLSHAGGGRPWAVVQSRAALPLQQPLWSGYRLEKTVEAAQRKSSGVWSQGDILRVELRIEAAADMTWVVVSDPIPAGATILGGGLGRDSSLLQEGESQGNDLRIRPSYTERSFEAFRAYFEFLPRGTWSVEYTLRLNQSGTFQLPATRVEALYLPEWFGELPNPPLEVVP